MAVVLTTTTLLVSACGGTEPDTAGATPAPPVASASDPAAPGPPPSPAPSTAPAAAEDTRVLAPRVAGTVAAGLQVPWGLAFLPDGSALVSERDSARILRVAPNGTTTALGQVPGVDAGGEGGLLGIALRPGSSAARELYAYFTAGQDNRVVRMALSPDAGALGAPQAILTGIAKANIHNGGRIAFGPDGFLYVATGDASRNARSQDPASLSGKILRLTPDGQPAPGNPTAGSPVWSLGHRNVQGLAFDSRGQLWASEFGQNALDELNRIQPGGNYGWPQVEGPGGAARGFIDPVATWATGEASPSGIAIAGNSVWMAALRGQRLWQIPIPGGAVGTPVAHFARQYGRLRHVERAPDGSLWMLTNSTDGRGRPAADGDRVLRITLS
jgi:glucose/arabinose dehydrogenase